MNNRPTDTGYRVVRDPNPPRAINWRSALRFGVLLLLVIGLGNGASAIIHSFTRAY